MSLPLLKINNTSPQNVNLIDIKLSFKCNNFCRFCVAGDKRLIYKDKTTEEVKKILTTEIKNNIEKVVFTGGEPTLRNDLPLMVAFAREIGYKTIQIQTNGRMFAYKDFCDKIVHGGANQFAISVHGHKEELHDYLTSATGSFKETIKAIKNLKDKNCIVATNTVITKSNYRNLIDIAKLLISLDVVQIQFAYPHILGNAERNFSSTVQRMSLIMSYLKEALSLVLSRKKTVLTEAIPYCMLNEYKDCALEKYVGSRKIFDAEGTIKEFTSHRIDNLKTKFKQCENCKYYNCCEGTWNDYPKFFGSNEFKPIKI